MKKTLVIAAIVFLFLILLGRAQDANAETFKNANGQIIGRSTTNNAGTQFYDASGRNTGRAVTNNAGTTFYNAAGQMTGRSSGRK